VYFVSYWLLATISLLLASSLLIGGCCLLAAGSWPLTTGCLLPAYWRAASCLLLASCLLTGCLLPAYWLPAAYLLAAGYWLLLAAGCCCRWLLAMCISSCLQFHLSTFCVLFPMYLKPL